MHCGFVTLAHSECVVCVRRESAQCNVRGDHQLAQGERALPPLYVIHIYNRALARMPRVFALSSRGISILHTKHHAAHLSPSNPPLRKHLYTRTIDRRAISLAKELFLTCELIISLYNSYFIFFKRTIIIFFL